MSQITTENTAVDELDYALTALDRCDQCGAQAYIRATMHNGDLLFCAHHGAKYKEKLSATALNWHDESFRLLEDRSN
jgi:predicted nucleic acid-binding Zn ribbon protein